jgi:hypothetical protein
MFIHVWYDAYVQYQTPFIHVWYDTCSFMCGMIHMFNITTSFIHVWYDTYVQYHHALHLFAREDLRNFSTSRLALVSLNKRHVWYKNLSDTPMPFIQAC